MKIKSNENICRRLSIILAGAILGSSFLLIFVADFISSSQDLILAGKLQVISSVNIIELKQLWIVKAERISKYP